MATTAWVTRPSRPLIQVSLSVAGRAGVLSQSVVPLFAFIVLFILFDIILFTILGHTNVKNR